MNGLVRKLTDSDCISILKSYDIIFLTETWLSSKTCYNLDITDCVCEQLMGNKSRNVQRGTYSGGISIYFRKSL